MKLIALRKLAHAINRDCLPLKVENIQLKKFDFFSYFCSKHRKTRYTCIPQFCYKKVAFKGVYIARPCFRDEMLFYLIRITKTCPCNVYPLEPHFYISKTGVYRGIPIFLIYAPKHRLWVFVRTASARPRRGGSNVYPQSMF